jgi:hypothetical protein
MLTTTIAVAELGGKRTQLVVMYLVGMFGCSRQGHIYGVCSSLIDERHNRELEVPRSTTYADDGILIDPQRLIRASVDDYCDVAVTIFGGPEGTINDKKIKLWDDSLIAIGWVFNFAT